MLRYKQCVGTDTNTTNTQLQRYCTVKWEMRGRSGSSYDSSQGSFVASVEVTMGQVGAVGIDNTTVLCQLEVVL
jgi:hypothetical protein